jgi:hypothetical protein
MPREMEVRIIIDHLGSNILEQYYDGEWHYLGVISPSTYSG